jgi:nucleoside-diphosphate-sugar epimerase
VLVRIVESNKDSAMNSTNDGTILVTGAAGRFGAVGRVVTGLLLERGLRVRAMVRREDDRASALRSAGAEVVVGDLLEPADVYRVVNGCRTVYFGLSVSAGRYDRMADGVERVTGRPPMSIWEFVSLHVEEFGGRRS